MEQAIKMEVKTEVKDEVKDEPCDENAPTPLRENDPTPLRERVGESPPRVSAPEMSMSRCGWDSDPEDCVPRSAPPTPGASLAAIKDELKKDPDEFLEELLTDIEGIGDSQKHVKQEVCVPPPPPPPSCTPPYPSSSHNPPPPSSSHNPPPPSSRHPSPPKLNIGLDGIPSAFTARDNLEDMDLCSLGDEESDADLIAEKMEILRKLATMNGTDEKGSGEPKKKKKNKKKKRSHRSNKDKEEEPDSKKRPRSTSSPDESQKENKRSGHWPGHRIKTEKPDADFVPVRADERLVRVVKTSNLLESQQPKLVPRMENLSIQDKRNLGVARAQLALQLFQKKAAKEDELEVLMVDTMCKLPVHESFRYQNGFENPSPLCSNTNVVYEFNSAPGTRIDLAKWGLEVLPQATRELLRILGMDVHRLKELQRTVTPSQHILKLKQEQLEQGVGSEEAESDKATLYKNAGTQTDRKASTRDAGSQARLETPLRGSPFWQKPGFNMAELTQQQSNVMYALQELSQSVPDAALAERIYRDLVHTLATKRHRQ